MNIYTMKYKGTNMPVTGGKSVSLHYITLINIYSLAQLGIVQEKIRRNFYLVGLFIYMLTNKYHKLNL